MMFRSAFKLVAIATLGATASAASAATLVFSGGTGGLTVGQTDYANFNAGPGGTFGTVATTGTAGLFTGSAPGVSAEPAFGDQGDRYFYVSGGGSALFTFGTTVSQFGFDLGSADDYNTVEVIFSTGPSQFFSGIQLNPPGPATGNQSIPGTNGRVTIFGASGQSIVGARFISGQPSFEFDNIGIVAVPEPSAWALMILGFGFVGGALRRSRPARMAARLV